MGTVDLANALVKWVIRAGFPKQEEYEDMVWEKTKDVMKEFVDYMEGDEIILYATACDNTAWERPDHPNEIPEYGPVHVSHRIVCVLMVAALFFMNGWHTAALGKTPGNDINDKIREHLLCAIVHMFSEVLNESVCRSEWGTFYAWKIMEKTGGKGGFVGGLIQQGKCRRQLVEDLQIRKLHLNAEVKKWLQQDSRLHRVIQKIRRHTPCKTPWKKGWKIADIWNREDTENNDTLGITQIVADLKEGVQEILQELGTNVQESIAKRQQDKKRKSGKARERGAE
ncbi:hypothetical protein AK88_05363 [Plasmodium fragile]|uniref:Schizont-infected cell agglutination extracellular alpha domain-containing protein n=1 Tax=Plasmodium fragile TaxID=5857 RepID=A0A0D9QDB5_PLAFR|nr:uncharacterized protein AK88_05363 [Plasmodium fragile]KJP85008.1 hypothetical protein AK88_05363 [Plasmodium fragile]